MYVNLGETVTARASAFIFWQEKTKLPSKEEEENVPREVCVPIMGSGSDVSVARVTHEGRGVLLSRYEEPKTNHHLGFRWLGPVLPGVAGHTRVQSPGRISAEGIEHFLTNKL